MSPPIFHTIKIEEIYIELKHASGKRTRRILSRNGIVHPLLNTTIQEKQSEFR